MRFARTYGVFAVFIGLLLAFVSIGPMPASPVFAQSDDDDEEDERDNNRRTQGRRLQADPFVFVGDRGECGSGYPAGSNAVTAAWLGGMGLPDNGGQNTNTSTPNDNPNKGDSRLGLLLNKNTTTPDCSSAGATIRGAEGLTIQASSELGFDYRNGGHCGAGAPRFNLRVTPPSGPETFHFIGGCANDAGKSPAPQDPQWTRVRFDPTSAAEAFPPVLPGSRIRSLTLLYDEGTDTSSTDDPQGVGLAVVDNIFVDGTTIPSGNGVATNRQRGRDDDDDHKPRRRGD